MLATLADSIILGIAYSVFRALFGGSDSRDTSGFGFTQLSSSGGLVWFAVVVVYYVLMEAYLGRTLGKMAMGIRVVGEDGGPPGLVSAIVRTFSRIIDGFAGYLVALLVVVNSKRRRRIGDMLAKTLVVKNP